MGLKSLRILNRFADVIMVSCAVFTVIVHLVYAKTYEPHRDEFLYISLGKHLDWGFASIPPFLGFLSLIAQSLFSDVQLGFRLFAALGGAALVFVTGKIVTTLGGKNTAVFLACLAAAFSPAYIASAALFQPVIFDIFFWTLAAYYFIKLLKTGDTHFWYPLILTWSIGFLNKYNIAFEIVGILGALLISPQRSLLFTKKFAWAVVIGLIVVSPNLFWQYSHHFPVIYHMNELQRTQLSRLHYSDFFLGQILDNLPSLWLWLTAFVMLLLSPKERWLRPIFIAFVITIALFVFGGAKHYYSFGLYPPFIAIGAYFVEKYWLSTTSQIFKWVLALNMLVVSILAVPIGLPVYNYPQMISYFKKIKPFIGNGLFTWENRKVYDLTQDYADETGWKELAQITDKAYESLSDDEKAHCVIFCENYGEAGAIEYFSKLKLPPIISFSDNYLHLAPDSLDITTFIYVNDDPTEIKTHFDSVTEFGRLTDPYAREKELPVFICRQPNAQWKNFYSEKVVYLKRERF